MCALLGRGTFWGVQAPKAPLAPERPCMMTVLLDMNGSLFHASG
jgi:hypothetical protein